MKRLSVVLILAALSQLVFAQNSARMLSGVNAQTSTSYTFVPLDTTRLTTFANSSNGAWTLPSPLTYGFGIGTIYSVQNLGSGTLTINCSSCLIFSSSSSGSSVLTLAAGAGADIYSGGLSYSAFLGGGGGGGGGGSGCVVNPADNGCALSGTPSIDLFIGAIGPGTGWLAQLLATGYQFQVPLNVQGSNAGAISLGFNPDPGVGSGVAIVAPASGTPFNIYLPQVVCSGYVQFSAIGNKATTGCEASINLASDVGTSVLPVANGGTGNATAQGALLNLFPTPSGNGTLVYYQAGNWNAFNGNTGTPSLFSELSNGSPGWINIPLPVADGGTGQTSLVDFYFYKGNGTGNMQKSAVSDNGTTVTSSEPINVPSCSGCSTPTVGTPSISVNTTGAGSGATATLVSGSFQYGGNIQLTTGSSPGTASPLLTVTFATAFPTNAFCTVTESDASPAGTDVQLSSSGQNSPSSFSLGVLGTALTAHSSYAWFYTCQGH
jgi:hypothetical protein